MMMADDGKLLVEFARTGSPEAFGGLVARHIDMVYAAACRQVGDWHEAEDVTQAVFMVLAGKAGAVPSAAMLPAWLLKVTHFAARDARKAAARRRQHEQEASAMLPTTSLPPDPEWDKLSPHLDAALARLSATDRAAVVAHCIQEKPLAELAADLGISEPAARKRVQRALERLRAILGPKASMPCMALATLIASHAIAPAPPALAATITTTALAALHGTAATGTALILAKGVMHMMFLAKAKLAFVIALAAAILTTATGSAVHYARAQTAPAATTAPLADKRAIPAETAPARAQRPDTSTPQKCMESFAGALQRRDIPIAASLFECKPEQLASITCLCAAISADMRLRAACLKAFGEKQTPGWLTQGATREEMQNLFDAANVKVNGDTATTGGPDGPEFRRVNGAWKIVPDKSALQFDLDNLTTAAAKNLTTTDIEAGKCKEAKDAFAAFRAHRTLMHSALGELGSPWTTLDGGK